MDDWTEITCSEEGCETGSGYVAPVDCEIHETWKCREHVGRLHIPMPLEAQQKGQAEAAVLGRLAPPSQWKVEVNIGGDQWASLDMVWSGPGALMELVDPDFSRVRVTRITDPG